jgi:hypothetical protein
VNILSIRKYNKEIAFCILMLCIFKKIIANDNLNSINVELLDQEVRGGWLSGDLTIIKSTSANKIYEYEINWGNNPSTKLSNYRPLFKISKVGSDPQIIEIQLKNFGIPPGATYFIIDSVLENNQSVPVFSYPIVDLGVPTYKAVGLSFQQTRSEAGKIQGEIRILPSFNERGH